jgi:3-deoxy-D-manno-octulosonate 8-phosphate phosphatase (KDO 8-P phosphatase)
MASYSVQERAQRLRALVLDVDGVLTDGRLFFDNQGNELKAFDVRDGLGMKLVQRAGVRLVVITGRESHIVTARMQSLGVDLLMQGREDKGRALQEACQTLGIDPLDCAYMGDDWPDLSAMQQVGLSITVPNGHAEVRKRADLVTQAQGGRGAVREICDLILLSRGAYAEVLSTYTSTQGSALRHG